MTDAKSKPSVAIVHGFAEGPAISKQLRKALAEAGFRVVRQAETAEIIIAHSGGIFLLPQSTDNKIIIMSAPSVGRKSISLLRPCAQKVWYDFLYARHNRSTKRWLLKSCFNSFYTVTKSRAGAAIWRDAKASGSELPVRQARKTLVISHKGDPWSGHIDSQQIAKHTTYAFMSHRGIHDDIWGNPQEYITVIQYLYES